MIFDTIHLMGREQDGGLIIPLRTPKVNEQWDGLPEETGPKPWDIRAIVKTLDATLQNDFTGEQPMILKRAPKHPVESGANFILTSLDLDPSTRGAKLNIGPVEISIESITDIRPEEGHLRIESVSETTRTVLDLNPDGSLTMTVTTKPLDLSSRKED